MKSSTKRYLDCCHIDIAIPLLAGGHHLAHVANLYLFVGTCLDHMRFKGHSTTFERNQCVFLQNYASDCGPDGKTPLDDRFGHVVRSNQVYSADGTLQVCGVPFEAWQVNGSRQDQSSSLAAWPTVGEVLSRVGNLLNHSPAR